MVIFIVILGTTKLMTTCLTIVYCHIFIVQQELACKGNAKQINI